MTPRMYLCMCIFLCSAVHAQHNSQNSEAHMRVRAQFIYNFANFVEWPNDAFGDAQAPIKICLFGEVDFAPYLNAFADTLIGNRPLKIQRTHAIEDIRAGCHILYVGQDERVKLPTFWQQIHYIYVLSIGARQGFADKGGIINILREQDKMQFEVNIENALANGLFLDSDLLALARVIKRNTAVNNTGNTENNAPVNNAPVNNNPAAQRSEKPTSAPAGAAKSAATYGSHKE